MDCIILRSMEDVRSYMLLDAAVLIFPTVLSVRTNKRPIFCLDIESVIIFSSITRQSITCGFAMKELR